MKVFRVDGAKRTDKGFREKEREGGGKKKKRKEGMKENMKDGRMDGWIEGGKAGECKDYASVTTGMLICRL